MKNWLRRIGIVLALVAIQWVPVDRTNPPESGQLPELAEVRAVVQRACYDCHSNETKWPWYSRIAPMSWWIAHDVKEGRKQLNFSLWDQYNERRKTRKFKEIAKEVKKSTMPQWYYVLMHPEAELSATERELIIKWAAQP